MNVPGNRWDLLVPLLAAAPQPTVQVVLPYFNQAAELRRALHGLAGQTYPRELVQVVVSDDGSAEPPPLEVARDAGVQISSIRQDDLGNRTSLARQRGAEAGDGEVLVFLDADMVATPTLLANLVRWPAVCPDALVVGRRRYAELDDLDPADVPAFLAGDRAVTELGEPAWLRDGYAASRDLLDADDRSFRFVISCVLAMRRTLFDDVGGFETATQGYGGEDWELGHRAWTNGAVLIHDREAVGWHHGPDWGRRAGSEAGKDQETFRLAAMIPEPSVRGAAQPLHRPDVVADVLNATWSDRQTVSTVNSLLTQTHADLAVRVERLPDQLAALWAGTGRVRGGPWPLAASRSARATLAVHRPGVLKRSAVTELMAQPAGRVRADVLTFTRTRALGRVRRHEPTDPEAFVAETFGEVRTGGLVSGVSPDADPSALFGGWA